MKPGTTVLEAQKFDSPYRLASYWMENVHVVVMVLQWTSWIMNTFPCMPCHPQIPVRDRVFDVLLYFCNREDEDIKLKALSGLGFLCNRHADFMLTTEVKDLYWKILTDPNISVKQLCLVRLFSLCTVNLCVPMFFNSLFTTYSFRTSSSSIYFPIILRFLW